MLAVVAAVVTTRHVCAVSTFTVLTREALCRSPPASPILFPLQLTFLLCGISVQHQPLPAKSSGAVQPLLTAAPCCIIMPGMMCTRSGNRNSARHRGELFSRCRILLRTSTLAPGPPSPVPRLPPAPRRLPPPATSPHLPFWLPPEKSSSPTWSPDEESRPSAAPAGGGGGQPNRGARELGGTHSSFPFPALNCASTLSNLFLGSTKLVSGPSGLTGPRRRGPHAC